MAAAESDEDKTHATVPSGEAISTAWNTRAKNVSHCQATLGLIDIDSEGGIAPNIKQAITDASTALGIIAGNWTAAAKHAADQHVSDTVGNTTLAANTQALQVAKLRAASAANKSGATSADVSTATAAVETARQTRTKGLSDWRDQADVNTSSLPTRAADTSTAVARARSTTFGGTDGPSTGAPTQRVQVQNVPSNTTPSKTTNPAKKEDPAKSGKPDTEAKKSGGGDETKTQTPTAQTPQQQQNAGQGGQPQQGQGQQPQLGGGGAQPAGTQPAGARPGTTPTGVPINTPINTGQRPDGKGGTTVRPAAALPPKPVDTRPLGSGVGAAPPNGVPSSNSNPGSGRGGTGASGTGTTGTGARGPMGGMAGMGGAHGGGQPGGTAKPKSELYSTTRKTITDLSIEQATGGVGGEAEPSAEDRAAFLVGTGGVTNISIPAPAPVATPSAPPVPPPLPGGAR